MSRPGPFVEETMLQPPRRPHHSNRAPDTEEPPRRYGALVEAADRVLWAVQLFVRGDLDYGALRLLVNRYQVEAAAAIARGEI